MTMDHCKIAIVGIGPVGGILAAHLALAGHEVFAVDIMEDHIEAIRSSGIEIAGLREVRAEIPHAFTDISALENRDLDLVFIALKVSVLHKMVEPLKRIVRPGTKVIAFQNGIGNEEYFASFLGPEKVMRVVVNYAGGLTGPGKIHMGFFTGSNWVGGLVPEIFPDCRALADMLTAADLETTFAEDLRPHIWEKSIMNAAMSPVTAVTGLTMKTVMDTPAVRLLVEKALAEGIAVARALGIGISETYQRDSIQYLEKAGHHKTSMLVDLESGRPTEIGFLNEKICEYGNEHGVETPFNLALTNLIRGLELSKGITSPSEASSGREEG